MGDPLSTAASIIAVLQLSASVVGYINTAVGATKDRKRLREEVRACEYILLQLKEEADDSREGATWLQTIETLEAPDGPLRRLWTALKTVKSKLGLKKGLQKTLTGLKWPFGEKEVEKLLATIEREKTLLELALHNNSGNLINTIRQDQNEEKATQKRDKILKWLSRIDYTSQQSDYIARRQAGTGQWFLSSVEFTTWVKSPKQTLFCPGIPGAGKTIITSIVIDKLTTLFEGCESVGIAYVYCDFKRHSDQTAEFLLRGLLQQLSQRQRSLPDCVEALYSKGTPSFHDISRALQSVCRLYAKVFVVVDAIDECQVSNGHRSTLLKEIFALQAQYKVNIFATSRFIPEITQIFINSQSLEIRARLEDVQKYLDGHILQLPSFVQQRPELQAEIKSGIAKAVDGMYDASFSDSSFLHVNLPHRFLLAQFHLDSLVGKRSAKAIRVALARLPSGPDAYVKTYEEALKRIDSQVVDQVDLAKQALSWIVCARRAVSTTEFRHALAVEIGEPKFDDENMSAIEDIISVCAGLLTFDAESNIIRLVHYTTQEFFTRKQKEWLPHAHADIAHTCLAYLSFDVFETGFIDSDEDWNDRLQFNPLYTYAAYEWGHHARIAATETDQAANPEPPERGQTLEFRTADTLQRSILSFLDNHNKLASPNQALFRSTRWSFQHQFRPVHLTAMHTAAYFGLGDIVVSLLQQNHNPDTRDICGRTPLWFAAENGHVIVVKILLQTSGVEPQSKDSEFGKSPLYVAAEGGHYEVVQLLLAKQGVDPMSRDTRRSTPLAQASAGGYNAVVELLLVQGGVDLMSRDDDGRTPILGAAAGGHEKVVKLLLANGADPNSRDLEGRTPLIEAACGGHENIVKMLLIWNGIRREAKDKHNRTPLSWAVRENNEAIVSLLLAQDGIDINCRDVDGNSPLFDAAEHGRQAIFEMLLAREEIELDSKNNQGETPLSAASTYGFDGIVKLLLAKDQVDPDSRDRGGRTPLHSAAAWGHIAVVELLVARSGADANTRGNSGRPLLSLAAERGRQAAATTQILLAKGGVDVNSKSKSGRTSLSIAVLNGKAKVVEGLLAVEGIDLNATDKDGKTALDLAIEAKENLAIGQDPWQDEMREKSAEDIVVRLLSDAKLS
ncbi:hypothetical protein AK830_g10354 [Neonectria ditissima]|uniref:Uncharacterized protein n=1 Tax=Neonectria ditissima TaxID=78410 RepID=A0A0P7B3Y4_9HYPO|nr:hypothetical protein AK830_g10354 [Neonectria ditissima]